MVANLDRIASGNLHDGPMSWARQNFRIGITREKAYENHDADRRLGPASGSYELIPPNSETTSADIAEDAPSPSDPWAMISGDYPEALVRIAALRADGVQHLIFGWVELYPFDMTAPDSWTAGVKPWPVPGQSRMSCTFSATKVPTKVALDWYAAALRGRINVAVASANAVLTHPLSLAPEPNLGRFTLNVEAPFVLRWHDGPRIHRLVSTANPNRSLFRLSRIEKAREWFALHLGFDPFRFDDWLGGAALVAPNPLCASFSVFRSARAGSGEESLLVQAIPRRTDLKTADLTTLGVHLVEKRGLGWSCLATLPITVDGSARLALPQPIGAVGHALVCKDRGLLRIMEPASWLDQINIDTSLGHTVANIEVPSGGRRKPADSYEITHRTKDLTSVIGEVVDHRGADRVRALYARRKSREKLSAAEQKVFGIVPGLGQPSAAEAEVKKKEAQDFIVDLVKKARRRLIFVDPFFGWREMRLFALRNENGEVSPRVLTGLQALKKLEGEHPGFQYQQGSVFLADLKRLTDQLGTRAPVVRVMPGGEQATIHDRYLIVDDEVWHCGPSFNELGDRLGVMVRLPDAVSVLRLVRRVWARSQSLDTFAQTVGP